MSPEIYEIILRVNALDVKANDDDYLASAWADPKKLQQSLRGTTTVRAPGV